ncbi:transcriptional repressor [Aquabacterium soli]|jgi:Fur family transcriptional regulator, ferric uptake regulator|uniref:Ferric uptake regulation protein n=1 Tax=Aquabacterium soli TaxID=2493092 RepID=A0A426V2I1_9BURK|nr:transcriptional repressor [Aquabacterium soli]RRS01065.1 transcriptional repressor [Aquabacterium soli]
MERTTRQREALRNVIEDAQRPLSPQEILDGAQAVVPGIGIATVYRNIKLLLDAGEIEVVTLPGENPRYEPAHRAHHHHHHFQCDACRRVFDVHECPGDLKGLAPKGFRVHRHELTLYGLCKECIALKRSAVASA